MAEQHELELSLLLYVADFTALTRQLQLEEVEWCLAFGLGRRIWLLLVHHFTGLVRCVVLYFSLALHCLAVLLLEVDLLVQDLVREAHDAPPEDVAGNLVELLGELVKDGRAALAEEGTTVVVHELHLLLALQFAQVEGVCLLVCGGIAASFLPDDDAVGLLAAPSTLGSRACRAICTLVDSFILRATQVLELGLGLLHLLIVDHSCARLRHTDLLVVIGGHHSMGGTFLRLGGSPQLSRRIVLVKHMSLILHSGLVVAAVLGVLILHVIFLVLDSHELLVELVVLMARALDERLATIIDDKNLLSIIIDTHVEDRAVRVDDIRLDVVLLGVEPLPLQVDVAAAIYKDKARNCLFTNSKVKDNCEVTYLGQGLNLSNLFAQVRIREHWRSRKSHLVLPQDGLEKNESN